MAASRARSAQTRETILYAAARDFAARGYAGATHATILKALGKSTPNYISYHYKTKADLAEAVFARQDQLWNRTSAALAEEGATGVEALAAMFFSMIADTKNLPIFQAALALDSDLAAPREGEFQPCAAWMRLVAGKLDEARDVGQIPHTVAVRDEAWMIVSVLYGVYQIASRLGDTDELATRFARAWHQLLTGLGVTDPDRVIATARARAAALRPPDVGRGDATSGTEPRSPARTMPS